MKQKHCSLEKKISTATFTPGMLGIGFVMCDQTPRNLPVLGHLLIKMSRTPERQGPECNKCNTFFCWCSITRNKHTYEISLSFKEKMAWYIVLEFGFCKHVYLGPGQNEPKSKRPLVKTHLGWSKRPWYAGQNAPGVRHKRHGYMCIYHDMFNRLYISYN